MPFTKVPPLYGVWQSMRRRCLSPYCKAYPDYGGRGISICPEWDSYETFAANMGARPPNTSIERVDNNKNYEPSNCVWAGRKTQQRNQRRTRYVTIDGVTHKAVELADISGLKTDTIVGRASSGFTYEQVIAPKFSTVSPKWRAGIRKAIAARVTKQMARTHCQRGHLFDDINSAGYRYCKTCERNKPSRKRKSLYVLPST